MQRKNKRKTRDKQDKEYQRNEGTRNINNKEMKYRRKWVKRDIEIGNKNLQKKKQKQKTNKKKNAKERKAQKIAKKKKKNGRK